MELFVVSHKIIIIIMSCDQWWDSELILKV